jgi:hypothetical protein
MHVNEKSVADRISVHFDDIILSQGFIQRFLAELLARSFLAVFCLALTISSLTVSLPAAEPVRQLAAPGLQVPDGSIPYALDEFQNKPLLIPIHHSVVVANHHAGANFAGSMTESFFYRPKVTVELSGEHARVQLHTELPVLYMHLAQDPEYASDTNTGNSVTLVLVRANVKKGKRILSTISFNSMGGHPKRSDGVVDVNIEHLPGGWIRITPQQPLSLDEYALMPIPNSAGEFAAVVFDFGINPSAPIPTDAIRPHP